MYNFPKQQKGMALLISVLVAGVAILGITARVGSSQNSQIFVQRAYNTSVSSQIRAWEASEVVRTYIKGVADPTTIKPGKLVITGVNGIAANVVSNNLVNGNQRIVVDINASLTDSSSTTVQVVYQVVPNVVSVPLKTTPIVGGISLKGNVQFGGQIHGVGAPKLLVDGSITSSSSNVTNFSTLCASEDINISNSFSADNICTLGNFTSFGSGVSIKTVTAIGTATVDSGSNITTLNAKGDVFLGNVNNTVSVVNTEGNVTSTANSSVSSNIINANGNVDIRAGGGSTVINSGGNVTIRANSNGLNSVNAVGNVTFNAGGANGSVRANGNLDIRATNSVNINNAQVKGNVFLQSNAANVQSGAYGGVWSGNVKPQNNSNLTKVPGLNPNVQSPGVQISIPTFQAAPVVDATKLKSFANYVYSYDNVAKKVKVTVAGINGIPEGSYYFGKRFLPNNQTEANYLCSNINASGFCTGPGYISSSSFMHLPGQNFNDFFSYNTSTDTLKLGNTIYISMMPGVHYFDGNIEIDKLKSSGLPTTVASFITPKNLVLKNEVVLKAPNTATYNEMCNNTNFTSGAVVHYPTQFCDVVAQKTIPLDVGNIVLLAGTPTSGGNIDFSGTNGGTELFGSIVAGNRLNQTGAMTVHGSIMGAGQLNDGETQQLGGSGVITLNLTNLAPNYNNLALICMGNCNSSVSGGSTGPIGILWSRYK